MIQAITPHSPLTTTTSAPRAVTPELAQVLVEYAAQWRKTEQAITQQTAALPPSARGVIEVQRAVQRLQFSTEIVTRVAESAAAVVRKAQQVGG